MARRSFALLLVLVLAAGALAQAKPPTQQPLPLDPLTPAEVAAARQIVAKDDRVIAIAGENPRVVVVLFIAPKSRENGEASGRWADVVVHNDRENGGARVLVNLTAGSVADVVRLTERNVPIGPGDVEAAAALALESGSVQRILGGPEAARAFRVAHGAMTRETVNESRIEGVSDRGADPDDPCTTHRCVALFFRTRGRYIAINQVTVDLTERRVYVREGAQP
jgi:hypothetical protein